MTQLPPSARVHGMLLPSYCFSSCYIPRAAPGKWSHPATPTEQGPYCPLPPFADPRRALRSSYVSCEESRLKYRSTEEATTSNPFYTRIPPYTAFFLPLLLLRCCITHGPPGSVLVAVGAVFQALTLVLVVAVHVCG